MTQTCNGWTNHNSVSSAHDAMLCACAGKPLDDMQLMGEMSMLLFGSVDTTSHMLAWTL